jgi:hypothetical protein
MGLSGVPKGFPEEIRVQNALQQPLAIKLRQYSGPQRHF